MTREMALLTVHNWQVVSESEVERALDAARENPGRMYQLHLGPKWTAFVEWSEAGGYTIRQQASL